MNNKKRKHFHHFFIPHRKNKFHPVALRPIGLTLFLVLYLSIPLLYNVTTAGQFRVLGYATNISVGALHQLTNQERANNGAKSLALNSKLNSAARAKADHMIANDYWAHVSPSGVTPWSFVTSAGYDYQTAGENLAKDFMTSSGVISGWMGSSSHRANMLSTGYSDVGFAVVNGVLQGSETTLVVAFYAEPTKPAPSPAPAQETAPAPRAQSPAPPTSQESAPAVEPEAVEEDEPEEEIEEEEVEIIEEEQVEEVSTPVTTASREDSGNVAGLANFAVIQQYTSLNWGQRASILLLCTLILLFVMKHTLIWREQKRGYRHIWLRSHPLGQATLLFSVLVLTLFSSVGVVL